MEIVAIVYSWVLVPERNHSASIPIAKRSGANIKSCVATNSANAQQQSSKYAELRARKLGGMVAFEWFTMEWDNGRSSVGVQKL